MINYSEIVAIENHLNDENTCLLFALKCISTRNASKIRRKIGNICVLMETE